MSIDYKKDVKPIIDSVLDAATALAANVGGPTGTVASIVAAGLRFASDLAAQGIDPVTHIERVHAADPALADAESAWAKALRDKFGA